MKRLYSIFLIIAVVTSFAACDVLTNIKPSPETTTLITPTSIETTSSVTSTVETTSKSITTSSSANTSFTKPEITWEIPEYKVGSVKLRDAKHYEIDTGFPVIYRYVWYSLPSAIYELVDEDANIEWDEYYYFSIKPAGVEPPEMMVVTFVKYFNIPKDIFEKAIEKSKTHRISLGRDVMHEDWELPNADIVYTFDNEIINNYYRRE